MNRERLFCEPKDLPKRRSLGRVAPVAEKPSRIRGRKSLPDQQLQSLEKYPEVLSLKEDSEQVCSTESPKDTELVLETHIGRKARTSPSHNQ
jgi:hypothetical protein